ARVWHTTSPVRTARVSPPPWGPTASPAPPPPRGPWARARSGAGPRLAWAARARPSYASLPPPSGRRRAASPRRWGAPAHQPPGVAGGHLGRRGLDAARAERAHGGSHARGRFPALGHPILARAPPAPALHRPRGGPGPVCNHAPGRASGPPA